MATTDAKSGFRLPWSADRNESDSQADEATDLRKKADDDIASIREWSKTEIARIREETDERITHRKDVLERDIEAHAAQIESRIERVQQRVAGFESQMASFFERLLAEDDPTRFAAMAESLPEPPPFDADSAWDDVVASAPVAEPVAVEEPVAEPVAVEEPLAEAIETPEVGTIESTESEEAEPVAEATAAEATSTDETPTPEAAEPTGDELIGVESTNGASPWGELPADRRDDRADVFGTAGNDAQAPAADPRLSALGLDADFAAAEAEAGAFPVETASDEQIPVIADDALAARLAGLVPDAEASGESTTTRVIVTGLVSVASIAGFKRNLARLSGVHSVGVTSGPDGEFVFAVNHDSSMGLSEQIATLPGFGARVTDEAPGELTVAARDPEAEG